MRHASEAGLAARAGRRLIFAISEAGGAATLAPPCWPREGVRSIASLRCSGRGRSGASISGEAPGQLGLAEFAQRGAQLDVADQAHETQVELGWVLDPAYTGHGYATDAVRELLRYCFQDLGVRRAIANCFRDNDTSWSLMERVGMRRELHAVRESLHRSGRWLDTVGYAILKEDWSPT
jgi:RimJ/RimL family protein N-acetyltransferase